ncbi:MAG TPA: hypothetical protein VFB00_08005 [Terriglobales bacterium]|nr:hypothetical protein [Terriglobales bacterium]
MLNESPNQTIRELWQGQPVEGVKMSAEEIRRRAAKFERRIMWRNIREYGAGAIAVALFASFLIKSHDVFFQLACALIIAGLAYMSYQLHRRASVRAMPADLGAANSLQFHRGELERQMDFIRRIWRWYLGPLVPGLVAFSVASLARPISLLRVALVNSIFAVCLILVWRLNVYAARCLQRHIDELSAAERAGE